PGGALCLPRAARLRGGSSLALDILAHPCRLPCRPVATPCVSPRAHRNPALDRAHLVHAPPGGHWPGAVRDRAGDAGRLPEGRRLGSLLTSRNAESLIDRSGERREPARGDLGGGRVMRGGSGRGGPGG